MKIILSRKGFDSGYGGIASPILPDGTMISFPIPSNDSACFNDLAFKGKTYQDLINELTTPNKTTVGNHCHLDPDIRKDIIKRPKGWKPIFGQCDAAETHLENQGVGKGDIFLFFGWFKKTSYENGLFSFEHGVKDIHVIYGYLQVGDIAKGTDVTKYSWHPHSAYPGGNNTMYIASDNLVIDGKETGLRGSGTLKYSEELVLTYPGKTRTKWKLPEFFKEVPISYHTKDSFKPEGYFQSAHKGQEFVVGESEEVTAWAKKLITDNVE